MFRTRHQRNLTIGLMGIYLFLLIWIVLFKFQIDFSYFSHVRRINLIPFHAPMIVDGRVNNSEVVYNVLVFIPLGLFASMFRPNWSFIKKVLVSFGISLGFELTQFVFAIGTSDITDLMTNTLGGCIGVLLFMGLYKAFKKRAVTIVNVVASVCSVLAAAFVGIMLYYHAL